MAVYLGNQKVLANGVSDTSLVLGHAETHASGGTDPLTPADIGAAAASHTHNYAPPAQSLRVTLQEGDWTQYTNQYMQTVAASGVTANGHVLLSPTPADFDGYTAARVRCTVLGAASLTFTAKQRPDADLAVDVLIVG